MNHTIKHKMNNSINNTNNNTITDNENMKSYHALLLTFLSETQSDHSLSTNINLQEFSRHSGHTITDKILQQIVIIQPYIEKLDLNHCEEVTDVGVWYVAKNCSMTLQQLNLIGCNKITENGIRSLSLTCSKITRLDFTDCNFITDEVLTCIAGGGWKLKTLILKRCKNISDTGISRIAKVCINLELLNLEDCSNVGELSKSSLRDIGNNCKLLRYLNLNRCKRVTDDWMKAIAHGCQQLEKLYIEKYDDISGNTIKELCNHSSNLSLLSLKRCKNICDEDMLYFHNSVCNTSLANLTLSGSKLLTDGGISALCRSLSKSLYSLNINECNLITDLSILMIANLCPNIYHLDVSKCPKLTNETLSIIGRKLQKLTVLKVDHNKNITIQFLLITMNQLRFVDIAQSWYGYQPKENAKELMKQHDEFILQTIHAIKIQSIIRRKKAYQIYKNKYRLRYMTLIIPYIQAYIRGYLQRKRWKVLQYHIQLIKSIILIQACYRMFRMKKRYKEYKKKQKELLYSNKMIIKIQNKYRQYRSIKRIQKKRNIYASIRLNEAKRYARYEITAIFIQKHYRSYLARKTMNKLYIEKEIALQVQKKQIYCIEILQRLIRGYLGRLEARKRLKVIEEDTKQWYCILNIQRVFRGYLGREIARKEAYHRYYMLKTSSAIVIQKHFRGYCGRLVANMIQALRNIKLERANAILTIQRITRGYFGRCHANILKEEVFYQQKINIAAIHIQKTFRGYFCRLMLFVDKMMSMNDHLITPLQEKLQIHENIAKELEERLNQSQKQFDLDEKELKQIRNELDYVLMTTNETSDSLRLNGILQRYPTYFLREKLLEYYNLKVEIQDRLNDDIEKLTTNRNKNNGVIRAINRDLLPLTINKRKDIRIQKNKAIRDYLKLKVSSCIKIQASWRRYLVLLGYCDPYRDYWIECYDEDRSDFPFYYNTYSKETIWYKPWAFKYFSFKNTAPPEP